MEKQFNQEDSMLLIRQMIEQAKGKIEKGDGKYFVLWGYIITIACIAHYLSYKLGGLDKLSLSAFIWGIPTSIGIIVSVIFAWKDSKKQTVKTYVSTMTNHIWIGFACSCLLISLLLSGKYGVFIYPAISLVYVYAVFLSASALHLRGMYVSAAICLVCVILYRFIPFSEYPLIMAAMLLCGNLIPGYMINYLAKRHV